MASKKKPRRRKLTKEQREAVDALIRRTAGKNAVDCLLKSSLSPTCTKYEIHGLSNGATLYVNIDKMSAHLMKPSSAIAKRFAKQHAKELAQ